MDRLHRRDFLATSSAAAVAAGAHASQAVRADEAVAAPAVLPGTREFRLAVAWPDTIAGFGDSAARLARRIEIVSGHRFEIAPLAGRDGERALLADDADLTHGFAHRDVTRHPAFAYFAGLPGYAALNALDLDAWLAVGGGQHLWDDLGAGFGFKPLLAGHTGRWPGLWSRGPIESLADLSGQGILALGLTRDVVAGLGAKPVDSPPGAWAAEVASGRAAAVEGFGLQAGMALGLARCTGHILGFGLAPAGSTLSLGIRRTLWDSLGAADQALFAACAAEEFRLTLAESRAHEAMLRRTLTEVHGIRIKPLPEDVLGALSGVADAVVAHAASRDRSSVRIDGSYMGFRHAVTGMEARQHLTS